MAIAFVQGAANTASGAGTTLNVTGVTITAGSLLVALWVHNHDNVGGSGTPTVTITDSRGQTWVPVVSETLGVASVQDGFRAGIVYVANAQAGSTDFTMTVSDSRTARSLTVLEYSGIATTSPLDGFGSTTRDGSPVISSAFNTSQNDALVVAIACTANGGNLTDYNTPRVASLAGTLRSFGDWNRTWDRILTSQGTGIVADIIQNNTAMENLLLAAAFKPAAAGGGGSSRVVRVFAF